MLIWRNLRPAAIVLVLEAAARAKALQGRGEDATVLDIADRRSGPPLTVVRSEP